MFVKQSCDTEIGGATSTYNCNTEIGGATSTYVCDTDIGGATSNPFLGPSIFLWLRYILGLNM